MIHKSLSSPGYASLELLLQIKIGIGQVLNHCKRE